MKQHLKVSNHTTQLLKVSNCTWVSKDGKCRMTHEENSSILSHKCRTTHVKELVLDDVTHVALSCAFTKVKVSNDTFQLTKSIEWTKSRRREINAWWHHPCGLVPWPFLEKCRMTLVGHQKVSNDTSFPHQKCRAMHARGGWWCCVMSSMCFLDLFLLCPLVHFPCTNSNIIFNTWLVTLIISHASHAHLDWLLPFLLRVLTYVIICPAESHPDDIFTCWNSSWIHTRKININNTCSIKCTIINWFIRLRRFIS